MGSGSLPESSRSQICRGLFAASALYLGTKAIFIPL